MHHVTLIRAVEKCIQWNEENSNNHLLNSTKLPRSIKISCYNILLIKFINEGDIALFIAALKLNRIW